MLWTLSHTPARCQLRSRRQHVMPEPQFISWSRYSHEIPVFNTNRIPVKVSRLLTGGLQPFGHNFCLGKIGSMTYRNSSGNSGLAMTLSSVTNSVRLISNCCIHRLFYYQNRGFVRSSYDYLV
jgi:hypothetical protein